MICLYVGDPLLCPTSVLVSVAHSCQSFSGTSTKDLGQAQKDEGCVVRKIPSQLDIILNEPYKYVKPWTTKKKTT